MEERQLDWAATQARAERMSNRELAFAIADCLKAAKNWPRMPLEGYYHDEASVYRAELKRRLANTNEGVN